MAHRNIVVIGGSAGGLEALRRVVRDLPADLEAAVFVVLHSAAESPGLLDSILARHTALRVQYAHDGARIHEGHVYVARADRHLILKPGYIRVTNGPKENRFRPAVDPLFRTAADVYGPRVIGLVLSGGQDDGAVGLALIKRGGGVAIVQDPEEALASGMPSAAIAHAKVDRVLTSDAIASALVALVREPIGEVVEMTHPSRPDVAEGAQDAIHQAKALGPPSPYSCPECGGTLWEFREGELLQYHCHLGHRFSGENLVEAQSEALDVALWAALRALEEHSALHTRMAKHARERGSDLIAQKYEREARDAEDQADRIRRVLISDSPSSGAPERLSSSGSA